ncbi:MAG: gliding motility-associated ABC transporter ATP-binding subunit GldA [Bacteroidales bacterium]|nr:gliding motility-associated ABC transporter ATP-binding subunit GldA [Bacteroidales bacterium]MDD3665456.1 gliding motility-associated ABC transporter ATP-binding subunit GldA [Bacteroidales bacterium]
MSVLVQNVSKLYGSQKALDQVNFTIHAGEVVGLLGPNGAGKSTMMKIITCFIPPSEGEVTVDGFSIHDQSVEVRRLVGYLPENNPLHLEMYVKEYLNFVARLYKVAAPSKRVDEMIELTGLSKEQHKKIGQLSKGYRQRVGIAQAMIHDPKVLILDEPTSGLDPNQLLEIRELIRMLGHEKTVMLSTHIMQEVEAICSRAIIINSGRIVADDSTSTLTSRVGGSNLFRIEFNGRPDKLKLSKIRGVLRVVNTDGSNIWEISASEGVDLREDLFRFAVDQQLTILSLNRETASLEKVFQSLTK